MNATLYLNGNLRFPAPEGPDARLLSSAADAVYVENGIIRAVGPGAELKLQLTGRDYRTVDWDGAYVLPGLTDSHMHLGMYGLKRSMLDFTGIASKEEMLSMIRRRAAVTPTGEWILGLNWNENLFRPAEAPHRTELDEAAGSHPLFLTRTCYHA